jgi:hypothetical protein
MRFAHVLLVSGSLAIAPSVAAQQMWTVPGIVRAGGQNGTRFVSDLVVSNPGGSPALVVLQFVPGSQAPVPYDLDPGASLTLTDVVKSVFGLDTAVGAVAVTSDQPLLIRGRTYNTASAGTFGVAVPVVPDDRILQEGETADSLWIQQDASPASGYRTNVAVVFPDAGGGAATVTLFDSAGNPAGQQDFSLDTPGLRQLGVGGFATGPLPVGRARIQVTRGRATGYAVVNDNVTGDGSLFPFESLPGGIQDVVVNGVARAGGALGTFWRTDARVYNKTGGSAVVRVAFHAAGDANPSPVTGSLTVAAGQVVDVPDVLASLLGLPVGSSGALRFQSDAPVAVLCRTSNLDPSGQRPGTFGAQQRAVPLLSYLTSADAGVLVSGVRQGSAFRTNVGFSAGPDGAVGTLTLKDPSGRTIASAPISLGSFGWSQPGAGSLFPGVSIPDGSQIVLKLASGSIDVFDSSIDNGSGDPVVTPAAAIPASIPSTATIGPAGGSVRSSDGKSTLKIPAGALGAPVSVSLDVLPGVSGPDGNGAAYTLTPGDLTVSRDALLVQEYGREDVQGSSVDYLGLALQSGSQWLGLTGGSLDTTRGTLTVPLRLAGGAVAGLRVRKTLAGPAPIVLSRFKGILVDPGLVVAVEGSGTVIKLTALYAGEGSARVKRGAPTVITRQERSAHWAVDGVDLEVFGAKLSYTVPACAPPAKQVRITADWVGDTATATIFVLPRTWTVHILQYVSPGTSCPPNPGDKLFVWKWGAEATTTFTLNDNLSLDWLAPLVTPFKPIREEPVGCPFNDPYKCWYNTMVLGPIQLPRIFDITKASYPPGLDLPGVSLTFERLIFPGYTLSNPTTQCAMPDLVYDGKAMGQRTEVCPLYLGFDRPCIEARGTVVAPALQDSEQYILLEVKPTPGTCGR